MLSAPSLVTSNVAGPGGTSSVAGSQPFDVIFTAIVRTPDDPVLFDEDPQAATATRQAAPSKSAWERI